MNKVAAGETQRPPAPFPFFSLTDQEMPRLVPRHPRRVRGRQPAGGCVQEQGGRGAAGDRVGGGSEEGRDDRRERGARARARPRAPRDRARAREQGQLVAHAIQRGVGGGEDGGRVDFVEAQVGECILPPRHPGRPPESPNVASFHGLSQQRHGVCFRGVDRGRRSAGRIGGGQQGVEAGRRFGGQGGSMRGRASPVCNGARWRARPEELRRHQSARAPSAPLSPPPRHAPRSPRHMAWIVALWAVAFAVQAALLGCAMYGLVVLSDLEADFVNPHDCAASLNKWMVGDMGWGGRWRSGAWGARRRCRAARSLFPS